MKKKSCVIKSRSGFTLIEMVSTIAVFGILVTIAIPTFSRWLPGYHMKVAARDVFSDLKLAKLEAIKRNQPCTVTIDITHPPAYKYTIDLSGKDVSLSNYGSEISLVPATTSTTIIFSPSGMATVTGYKAPITNNACVTLISSKITSSYQVTVSGVGTIKLNRISM
jgi:prepilin-type N-terminal cleavage/methylation domain-containing protein